MSMISLEDFDDAALIQAFVCYFNSAKTSLAKGKRINMERFYNAIYTAISGVNFPEGTKIDVLEMLVGDLPNINEAIQKVIETQKGLTQEKKEQKIQKDDSSWLSLEQVCEKFSLSKANVKDKAWRDKFDFPYHQVAAKGAVRYNVKEVEEWIKKSQK